MPFVTFEIGLVRLIFGSGTAGGKPDRVGALSSHVDLLDYNKTEHSGAQLVNQQSISFRKRVWLPLARIEGIELVAQPPRLVSASGVRRGEGPPPSGTCGSKIGSCLAPATIARYPVRR